MSADRSLTVFLLLTVLVVFVLQPLLTGSGAGEALTEVDFSLALVVGTVRSVRSKYAALFSIPLIVATLLVRWLQRLAVVSGLENAETGLTAAMLGQLYPAILIGRLVGNWLAGQADE